MSRVRIGALAGAVCALAALLGTAAAGADTTTPPRDQLRSFVCQKALDPPARAVSVQAVMRPVTGTAKMQIRFELFRETGSAGPFTMVRGRLLGSWITPQNPTLGQRPDDVWILSHPVVDLAAPDTYRFRVAFRWIGAQGQRLATAAQTSPTCYQPELRADLLVRSLTVGATSAGSQSYTAVIANRGQTGAGPFQVVLAGAGSTPQTETVAWLASRSTAREQFVAPACTAGTNLTVTVDPAHTIDEFNFANNTLTEPCPTPVSASG
ncbi:MAG TPA: CARDB domain-containing protein [Solirubrobacteraceae bacterium]|nr:CARDB domain-containing protein [Solirubrobacteraceae bacterium]